MAFSGSLLGVSSSSTCHAPSPLAITAVCGVAVQMLASFRSCKKNLNNTRPHFVDSAQPDELQREHDFTVKSNTCSLSRRLTRHEPVAYQQPAVGKA